MVGVASRHASSGRRSTSRISLLGANGYGIETVDSARDHAFRLYLDLASRRRVKPARS